MISGIPRANSITLFRTQSAAFCSHHRHPGRPVYEADWADFACWAADRGAIPLPCPPGLLCGYLSVLAERGLAAATITRRVSAIAHRHRSHGLEPPNGNEAVRQVLRGIRASSAWRPSGKPRRPATWSADDAHLPADALIGLRDRALLAIGLAGAFRRSELLALTVADLATVPEGLRITVRRSKTDQTGAGQTIALLRRCGHC